MTKQQEIKKGLRELFHLPLREGTVAGSSQYDIEVEESIDVILQYLSSHGGVIENKDKAIFHHGYFPLIEPLIEGVTK